MSDSDEYDKISDFEGDAQEEVNDKSVAEFHSPVNSNKTEDSVEKDDKSESNDSYVFCTEDLTDDDPPIQDIKTYSNQADNKNVQTTNKKLKDLTIEDVPNAVETETAAPGSAKVKTGKNEYLRFLEEDRQFDLDTKLHEHITQLCSEARKVATNEYEKAFDIFGSKGPRKRSSNYSIPSATSSKKAAAEKQQAHRQDSDVMNEACHKMFLQEQKYINLQIQLAETNDPTEKQVIEKECKEAEMEWINSKTEYEQLAEESKATEMGFDKTVSNKDYTNDQTKDNIVEEKYYDAVDKHPEVPTNNANYSSISQSTTKSDLNLKIQKAKATMQSYAQNFSSLKLQMYQQTDKKAKAKYNKFYFQAEKRWKESRKEYEKLCNEAAKMKKLNYTAVFSKSKKAPAKLMENIKLQYPQLSLASTFVTVIDDATAHMEKQCFEQSSLKQCFDNQQSSKDEDSDDALLTVYDTMSSFEQHYKKLQKQLPQIDKYATDEFKSYFINIYNSAKNRWEKSKAEFERLNRIKEKPETTVSVQQPTNNKNDVKNLKNYHCRKCETYITNEIQIINPNFFGATGAAFILSKVENVKHGEAYEKHLMTGKHCMKDVYCKNCDRKLGWFYEGADEDEQKYKEGKTVIEKILLQEVPVTVTEDANIVESVSSNAKTKDVEMEDDDIAEKALEEIKQSLKVLEKSRDTFSEMNEALKNQQNKRYEEALFKINDGIGNARTQLEQLQNPIHLESIKRENLLLRKRALDVDGMFKKRFKDDDNEEQIKLLSYKIYKNGNP